jgi:hypothetical protein
MAHGSQRSRWRMPRARRSRKHASAAAKRSRKHASAAVKRILIEKCAYSSEGEYIRHLS